MDKFSVVVLAISIASNFFATNVEGKDMHTLYTTVHSIIIV